MLAALAFAAAGCAGGSGTDTKMVWHAGMSQDGAMQEALVAAGREVRDPKSALYKHRIRPVVAQKGSAATAARLGSSGCAT